MQKDGGFKSERSSEPWKMGSLQARTCRVKRGGEPAQRRKGRRSTRSARQRPQDQGKERRTPEGRAKGGTKAPTTERRARSKGCSGTCRTMRRGGHRECRGGVKARVAMQVGSSKSENPCAQPPMLARRPGIQEQGAKGSTGSQNQGPKSWKKVELRVLTARSVAPKTVLGGRRTK